MNLSEINNFTIKAYNKTASKYHEFFKDEIEQKKYDREILDRFSEMIGKKGIICDAGCGPSAQNGKYLLNKNHKIVGIDISSECIKIAKNHVPEIEFFKMNMMNTDFTSNKFDGVISFYSILFTPKHQVDNLIKEFNRILKIDGKLLIVVKKGEEEGMLSNEWYEGNQVYFTHFVEKEMEEYLRRNGFNLDLLDTRKPYEHEIDVDRIYIIGSKVENCD